MARGANCAHGMHISSNTTSAFGQVTEWGEEKGKPHRAFPASAGSKEEHGVVAGLGDGAVHEVLELTAQHDTKSSSYR
jgi:hypothetical protein